MATRRFPVQIDEPSSDVPIAPTEPTAAPLTWDKANHDWAQRRHSELMNELRRMNANLACLTFIVAGPFVIAVVIMLLMGLGLMSLPH